MRASASALDIATGRTEQLERLRRDASPRPRGRSARARRRPRAARRRRRSRRSSRTGAAEPHGSRGAGRAARRRSAASRPRPCATSGASRTSEQAVVLEEAEEERAGIERMSSGDDDQIAAPIGAMKWRSKPAPVAAVVQEVADRASLPARIGEPTACRRGRSGRCRRAGAGSRDARGSGAQRRGRRRRGRRTRGRQRSAAHGERHVRLRASRRRARRAVPTSPG